MKQGEENFEFIKEDEDKKRNYILQKDNLTKNVIVFVATVLILLILGVIFIPKIV